MPNSQQGAIDMMRKDRTEKRIFGVAFPFRVPWIAYEVVGGNKIKSLKLRDWLVEGEEDIRDIFFKFLTQGCGFPDCTARSYISKYLESSRSIDWQV
jgi:hypothetical protein